MNIEDIQLTFGVDDLIKLPSGNVVKVERFQELFKEANKKPTYNELIIIDGGKKGYKDFFNECKEQGILG